MDITVAVSSKGVIKSRRTVELEEAAASGAQLESSQNGTDATSSEMSELLEKYKVGFIGSLLAVFPCFFGYWATATLVDGMETQLFSLAAFWIYGLPTIMLTGPFVVVGFWRLIENRMPLWIFSMVLIVSFLSPVSLFLRYIFEPKFKMFFIANSQSGLEHVLLAQFAVLLVAFVPAMLFSFITAQAVSRSKLSRESFEAF